MAHIFDIMGIVCREINSFAKHTNNTIANVPDFLMIEANRAIDTNPDIRVDDSKPIVLGKTSRSYAGCDDITVYTSIASNIKYPIIDTFAMISDKKDSSGTKKMNAETAYGIILPSSMMDETTDIETIASMLRKIYLSLLDTDPNMHYSAEPAILRLFNSSKIRIPTYDIEMMICAVCFIFVSLGSWFVSNENRDPVPASYALDTFSDKEIPASIKERIGAIMDKYCASSKSLRDAVGTGKLLKVFFTFSK